MKFGSYVDTVHAFVVDADTPSRQATRTARNSYSRVGRNVQPTSWPLQQYKPIEEQYEKSTIPQTRTFGGTIKRKLVFLSVASIFFTDPLGDVGTSVHM